MPNRRAAAVAAAVLALAGAHLVPEAAPNLIKPLSDVDGALARAAASAMEGYTWYGLDGHLHTDHSHDAGLFHQQQKRPESHDTTVAEQLAEAARWGETIGTLTDHRTYDQAYDPEYRSDSLLLLDGEEWGGYPHATAWGISETLEQGQDEGSCGVARAASEVRAQDGIFGVAHPEDGRRPCVDVATLASAPLDHLEAFRAPHTAFWERMIQAGRRLVPATGSDNHFRQLYGTDGGPGHNSTLVLARERTQAGVVEAVRAGRVASVQRALGPSLTTLADADDDGTFEALTGAGITPAAPTIQVAFRAQLASGMWLQVVDGTGAIVAQDPVALHDQTLTYRLPSSSAYYRGQLSLEPVQRITGYTVHEYLAYEDTLKLLSAPIYLSPGAPVENGTQTTASGALDLTPDAAYAGFADIADSDGVLHVVWQERRGTAYDIVYRRSADGTTWSSPMTLATGDPRTPSIAAEGNRVVVAYESHHGGRHGGIVNVLASSDRGETFDAPVSVNTASAPGARPAVATDGAADHVVWMSMEDGYKIRHARRTGDGGFAAAALLSTAVAREGGMRTWLVPPSPIRHVPAALHPTVAVSGGSVAVAWEDNRQDPTPLRNGTPDDWGIFGAFSSDGGLTWSADARITPRHDRKPGNPSDPESIEGNPARHPELAWDGATLHLVWQDSQSNGGSVIKTTRSTDTGATWSGPVTVSAPSPEFAYRPGVAGSGGTLQVVWQASAGARWSLRTASSTDGGTTFTPEAAFTAGTGFAGFPGVAGGGVVWTGERGGRYGVHFSRR